MFVYINVNASSYDLIIPDLAIRVRVIANSNSLRDQTMKMKVREYIEESISPLLVDVTDIDIAREIISLKIDGLNNEIGNLFRENDYNMSLMFFLEKIFFLIKIIRVYIMMRGNMNH